LPLLLPADAALEELRNEVEAVPGRYRLDALDASNKPIEGASGYVMVHALGRAAAASSGHSTDIVLEAMRMNAEMARTIIERFPAMLDSAATLLRAADGAGLPRRTPIDVDDQDDDIEEDEPSSFDLPALVAQIVPMVLSGLSTRKKLAKAPTDPAPASEPAEPPKLTRAATVAPPPVLDAKGFAHIAAIQAALTPEEAALAREVAQDLAPEDLQTWFAELSTLSVAQAVARVRTMLQPQQPSEAA
jgi:hypothetical protein